MDISQELPLVIDEMVEKGYIVKNGKGASVRYSICGEKVVKK